MTSVFRNVVTGVVVVIIVVVVAVGIVVGVGFVVDFGMASLFVFVRYRRRRSLSCRRCRG